MIEPLPDLLIEPVVRAALAEDLGRAGDITAMACIDADARLDAVFAVRQRGVLSGLACARLAVLALDPEARFEARASDGDVLEPGAVAAFVSARARALLSAERTALNLMGRMSGVATLTRTYVDAVHGTGARIVDTRKTTPGLRHLEKYAVRCGGGVNHRFGLDDAILIKDNHIAVAGGVAKAYTAARAFAGHLVAIEIEVDSLAGLEEALGAGATIVLLDNMDNATMAKAVEMTGGRFVLEASGNVTLDHIAEIAATGVDYASSGWITHSAPNLDVGLDIEM